MRLTDEELRDVLARAEEIQRSSRTPASMRSEFEAVLSAGEAVGLDRPAVERALRERIDVMASPPAPGELVFARSADGRAYVAEVKSVDDHAVRVRFLRGSEGTVTHEQVQSCEFLPGERLTVEWPWWGPWTCTVVSYIAERGLVELTDGWGETKWFPIAEVWRNPRKATGRGRISATLLGIGAAAGAAIGSVVTFLLMR